MVASIIFPALIPAGDSGYTIENAIWLDGGADYLNKTFSGTGTNRMKFTFSCWFKLGALGATGTLLSCDDTSSDAEFMFWVQSDGTIRISNYVGGTNELSLISERLLRDPTAWYHLILSANTDSVTPSASTIKLYLNGVQIPDADLSTHTYPDEDFEFSLGNAFDHEVGRYALSNNNLWNGYIAEMVFVDGNNLAHTDFGEFDSNGVWVPKDPSTNIDDYGNNGFLLQFKENGSGQDANGIGADTSEKDNHWAVGGGAVQTNQVTDTPTDDSDNNIGNYATLNPLDAATTTLSNGNVTWASSGSSGWQAIRSTQGVSTGGKVYFEVRADESSANYAISVGTGEVSLTAAPGATNGVASVIQPAGNTWEKFDGSTSSRTLGVTTGTVWGFAVDFDNQDLYLSKDGQWWNGSAFSGGTGPGTIWDDTLSKTAGPLFLICHGYNAENTHTARFRNADWSYSAPANYTSLNTANITAPTVKNPDDGFVFITLEDGDTIEASLATARSGWSSYIDVFKKEADDEDYDVRFSDDSGNSMHFNTDAAAGSELTLASSVNYSAWSWRVGAAYGCYTAEISHDNSSATNQAHGLGSGAKSAVAKRSDSTGDWYVSHPNMSSANIRWNQQDRPSTTELVTVDGTNITLSTSFPSGTYRVIVWEQIEGFSAFTGYSHNGSTTDGPYIHLGGAASLIAWRNIDSSNSNDFFPTFPTYSTNGNGNPADIRYNWNNQEKGYSGITIGDVTANGFKMRPSAGGAFGIGADDPMLVWAWGIRPPGGGAAQARAR